MFIAIDRRKREKTSDRDRVTSSARDKTTLVPCAGCRDRTNPRQRVETDGAARRGRERSSRPRGSRAGALRWVGRGRDTGAGERGAPDRSDRGSLFCGRDRSRRRSGREDAAMSAHEGEGEATATLAMRKEARAIAKEAARYVRPLDAIDGLLEGGQTTGSR